MIMKLTVDILFGIYSIFMGVLWIKILRSNIRNLKESPSVWTLLSVALDLILIGINIWYLCIASSNIIKFLKDVFLIIESY